MSEKNKPTFTVIEGGKDTLVDRLTEGLPNIFFALRNPRVSLFQRAEEITPEIITRIAEKFPTSAPEKEYVPTKDLIVLGRIHPSVIQNVYINFYSGSNRFKSRPAFRIGSTIYLQRTTDELEFPCLDNFTNCSKKGHIFGAPPDYEFFERVLNIGSYRIMQEVGVPTYNQPHVHELVQSSIKITELAGIIGPALDPSCEKSDFHPLTIDHIGTAKARLTGIFQSWTRIEQKHDRGTCGAFISEGISDNLSQAMCEAFQITARFSSGIAEDYLRKVKGNPTKIRSIGYYGTNLPERTYENFTQKINDYLAATD